tara:strand:- start:17 stop:331 length:315 start_codon:yes stop_codon:yes gene_type:complete
VSELSSRESNTTNQHNVINFEQENMSSNNVNNEMENELSVLRKETKRLAETNRSLEAELDHEKSGKEREKKRANDLRSELINIDKMLLDAAENEGLDVGDLRLS